MSKVIEEFTAIQEAKTVNRIRLMNELVSLYTEQHKKLKVKESPDFNVFSLLQITSDEVRHSAFLAWLLKEDGGHGQSNLFLKSFLELCRITIDRGDWRGYFVETEYHVQESIVDIVIYKPRRFLIYLENKIWAPEGNEQLAREFRDMRRVGGFLGIPEEMQFAVYLSPYGTVPRTAGGSHWIILSYTQLNTKFTKLLPSVTMPKATELIADWLLTIKEWSGADGHTF